MLATCSPLRLCLLESSIAALHTESTMTDEGPGTPALGGSQFAQLMEAIHGTQTRFDKKLEEFKDEVHQGKEEAATKALKHAQYDRGYTFRKKGNEAQTRFNEKVQESVADAQAALATAPRESPSIQRTKDALEKGAELLAERQKLIRITDRSEFGMECRGRVHRRRAGGRKRRRKADGKGGEGGGEEGR